MSNRTWSASSYRSTRLTLKNFDELPRREDGNGVVPLQPLQFNITRYEVGRSGALGGCEHKIVRTNQGNVGNRRRDGDDDRRDSRECKEFLVGLCVQSNHEIGFA